MCHYLVETRFVFGARSGVRVEGMLLRVKRLEQRLTHKRWSIYNGYKVEEPIRGMF